MCQQNRTAESGLKYKCTHGAVDVERMKALNASVLSQKTRSEGKSHIDADGFKTSATVINMLIMFTVSFRTDDNGQKGVWLCYKTQ